MPPPPPIRRADAPDDMPHAGVSDPPLALDARTPGRRGLPRKLVLAALGLLFLFAIVAGMWIASHYSRAGALDKPAAELSLTR